MEVITTTRGAKGLPRWFEASFEVLKGLDAGRVDIALPDGRVFRVEGKGPGPAARIDVKNPAFFARVAREGELGFCEAYLDGWWDTPDLQALLDVLLSSTQWVRPLAPRRLAGAPLAALQPLVELEHQSARRDGTFPATTTSATPSTPAGSTRR